MDYKEKYEMALEGIQEILGSGEDFIKMSRLQLRLQGIFPELKENKESDDERIRKELIEHINRFKTTVISDLKKSQYDSWIAWLENKVEPKFHEGDWLCENEPNNYARFIQILEIVNVQGKERYRISRDIHNDEDIVEFDFVEKYYHKFGIKDAKDGDVLMWDNGRYIILFKKIKDNIVAYCSYNTHSKHFGFCSSYDTRFDCILNFRPATKEQRDTLMKAMKEAGFTFDFEKKELKKIEPTDKYEGLTDFEKALADICVGWIGEELGWKQYIKDNADVLLKIAIKKFNSVQDVAFEQNTTWSEEDKITLNGILSCVKHCQDEDTEAQYNGNHNVDPKRYESMSNWIKSLKDRVQPQPKQEWNQEDEDIKQSIIDILTRQGFQTQVDWFKSLKDRVQPQPKQEWNEEDEKYIFNIAFYLEHPTLLGENNEHIVREMINWLKSLRPKKQWKPTEQQMKVNK